MPDRPIIITGAAGLVGLNLIPRLLSRGYEALVGIDKHSANLRILAQLHPSVRLVSADLSRKGDWEEALVGARALVIAHAQIAALDEQPFVDNNVIATANVLGAA